MSESKEPKTFTVYLVNGSTVNVKAHYYRVAQSSLFLRDSIIFYDQDNKPMEEYFIAISQIAAVIPSKGKSQFTSAIAQ